MYVESSPTRLARTTSARVVTKLFRQAWVTALLFREMHLIYVAIGTTHAGLDEPQKRNESEEVFKNF